MTATRLREFPLPDVGEGLTEAEILEWKVAAGDTVSVNQVIVEIETAKAAVELPCPWAGRVHALLIEPGVTIDVGTPIIAIDTDPDAGPLPETPAAGGDPAVASDTAGDADATSGAAGGNGDAGSKIGEVGADGRIATLVGYIPAAGASVRRPRKGATAVTPEPTPAPTSDSASGSAASPENGPRSRAPLATPPVRKLAKDLGVDLRTVQPTGDDGVIRRADVENAAGAAGTVPSGADAGVDGPGVTDVPAYDPATRQRRVPIKGVRKMTAQAMVTSAFTAPHVTEFLTVDVTEMMALRERLKTRREFAGLKVTPLTLAARAVCIAMRRTPEINAVWDEQAGEILYQEYVHLGIAAATPRGLVVPNVRDADAMSLPELAAALAELTAIAREGRTPPAAMTGGTFTITNVGVFGVDTGTPIINPGESAILALGSIREMPWVVDGELAVRKVCQLALSFDHRVIDGQQGSEFLADVGALLAEPGLAMAF